MAITRVQIVSVPVGDQDRARDFYVGTLGFELVQDQSMGDDQRWVQVAPPGGQTSLTLVTWFPSMLPGSLKGLVVATDDIDAEVARLRGRGVAFSGPVEDAPWGRFTSFDDPDGNGLVLQQSR